MPEPTGQHTHILHQERATKTVTGGDELEEEVRGVLLEGNVTYLVDHYEAVAA